MQPRRSPDALPPGHRLDRYRIEAVLGQGGFGITYRARNLQDHRLLAVKEYFPAASAVRAEHSRVEPRSAGVRDEFGYGLQRFRREAETLARFNHASIVKVWGLLDANGTAYIVMGFEEGETLGRVLEEWPDGLQEAEIVRLFGGLADGLSLVHGTDHLHRDLAPDNIIIRRDRAPVIIDFGAARCAYGQRTRSLEAVIKNGYSPPEQYMLDSARQGPWTDVYALGAIAYRCVGGRTPPGALDRQSAAANGLPDPLPPAASIRRGRYSAGLLEAIDRALRLSPGQRPASVAAWYAMFPAAPHRPAPLEASPPTPDRAEAAGAGFFRRLFGGGRRASAGAGHRRWVLAGTDSRGGAVSATIHEDALRRSAGRLVIGRDEAQSHVTIADQTVSRRHAVLSLDEDGLRIADAGSSNGTWVDGRRLAPSARSAPVGDSARITLGSVDLVLSAPPQASPTR